MDADGSATLTPKNWSTFQHYKDRNPSWIKLHVSLLDDPDFMQLPVPSQLLCFKLWMLSSKYPDGVITATNEQLAWRFRMSIKDLRKDIEPVLAKCYYSASKALAERLQDASPRALAREEKRREETETEKREYIPQSLSEVSAYGTEIELVKDECSKFFDFYTSNGWKVGRNPMKDWKAALRNWKKNAYNKSSKPQEKSDGYWIKPIWESK